MEKVGSGFRNEIIRENEFMEKTWIEIGEKRKIGTETEMTTKMKTKMKKMKWRKQK